MYTLDQARSFIAVAEELHFGRAAVRLQMTQPPLSRQIQKLERSIGVDLLRRDNRNVALTAGGRAFLTEARRLVAAADQAPRTARRIASGRAGEVRIGFTAVSGFTVLGPLLGEIARELPEVDIELEELVTSEQIQTLRNGELDLGIARPPFDTEQFHSRLLLTERLCLVVPSDHPLTRLQRPLTVDDLRELPLIMHSPTKARYFYDLVVGQLPIEHRNVIHTVSQILTMVTLVSAGRGVAFVPESAQALGIEGVSYLRLTGLAPESVELHAIWNREAHNPALSLVLAVLDGSADL